VIAVGFPHPICITLSDAVQIVAPCNIFTIDNIYKAGIKFAVEGEDMKIFFGHVDVV
jgi:hypothetical protein